MFLHRYPKMHAVVSDQDPFADMLDWLSFLTASDYLVNLLHTRHGISPAEARARSRPIMSHVRIASGYVQQSLAGPAELSFLPAYYAILNLLKVYVLLGPYHAELEKNRWHGAMYDVTSKDSRSIETEIVTIKRGGVIPLFYRTVTGSVLSQSDVHVELRDVLPLLRNVSHEYQLASGRDSRVRIIEIDVLAIGQDLVPQVRVPSPPSGVAIRPTQLKLLRAFKSVPQTPNTFHGKPIAKTMTGIEAVRLQIRPYLLYAAHHQVMHTPVCGGRIEMMEELPIALFFFYMSSVVRYKPEFFSRLRDSRYWPLLSAARTHSFHAFLLAFWSFMAQENYVWNPRDL
jgi:hypothetical protein